MRRSTRMEAPSLDCGAVVECSGAVETGPPQSRENAQNLSRVRVLDLYIDPIGLDTAVSMVWAWLEDSKRSCRFVVTPNLDHARLHRLNPELRAAYKNASLVLADGMPLVWIARFFGCEIPERVPGSLLVPTVVSRSGPERLLRVFFLGGAPGVADRAASTMEAQYPYARCVGCLAPHPGFENRRTRLDEINQQINAATPDLLVVGLGAPKQEIWINREKSVLDVKVAIAAGATIDFMAGAIRRAPLWMQKNGLEWLHRIAMEPRRLFPRYLRDALALPELILNDVRVRMTRRQ